MTRGQWKGAQVATQMKWDCPLMEMRQHKAHPSTGGKGSDANKWHHKRDGEDSRCHGSQSAEMESAPSAEMESVPPAQTGR